MGWILSTDPTEASNLLKKSHEITEKYLGEIGLSPTLVFLLSCVKQKSDGFIPLTGPASLYSTYEKWLKTEKG